MVEIILFLHVVQVPLRIGLALLLLIAAALALASWLERSRRISPFGAVARGIRASLDPLLAPIDRLVARGGGQRTSTPWWGVFAVLVAGALLLGTLEFVRNVLAGVHYAGAQGPSGVLVLLLSWSFTLLQAALLVRVITSWVGGTYSWIGRTAYRLTEWMLGPIRQLLPRIGVVDITPLVAWFGISLLRGVLMGAIGG
ncbi:MAG: YggT family protein [Gemmatimonadaceae bacterium]|nr:YggT family protein [Gemmatimonadaceae bacterium]MCW5825769.1 YggT family protein [Gemmatimonadaceae bacterium]